jgi:hypothetical protein
MGTGRRLAAGLVAATVVASVACVPPPEPNTLLQPGGHLDPTPAAEDRPWPLHLIDGRYRGANALGPGDVNHDGLTDYVTNYEFDQRYVISLHPPAGSDPATAWQTIDLRSSTARAGQGSDTENAALGDLDGDGNLDVAGVQGGHNTPFWEGYEPGVRIIWGPHPGEDVTDAANWVDAGRLPDSLDSGHLLWVQVRDLDADGAPDLVIGGRQLFLGGPYSSVNWMEAPADPADRRDLTKWVRHDIDPDARSGHGFEWGDMDGDGLDDLVLNNADFDTANVHESVTWYRNPGPAAAAARPWDAHVIDMDPAFEPKPGLSVVDFDGDGRTDVLTTTAMAVYWYRNDPAEPSGFEKVVIPKPAETQQFSRPVRAADVDGDGRLDIVGGLVHEDGLLPEDEYSLYWMEHSGPDPRTATWTTHVIKYGPGRTMLMTPFGEKWDMMSLEDVDGDGDLDVVANSEEWYVNDGFEVTAWENVRNPESQSVMWFENTLDEPARTSSPAAAGSPVVIEAEDATILGGGPLVPRSQHGTGRYAGFSASGYLQGFRGLSTNVDPGATELEKATGAFSANRAGSVRYDVSLPAGDTVELWVRRLVPASFGYTASASQRDSIWASIDGGAHAALDQLGGPTNTWVWQEVATDVALSAGDHQLTLELREPGYALDQLVLAPTGWAPPAGPA